MSRALPSALVVLASVVTSACASSGAAADVPTSDSSTVTLTRVGGAVQLTEDAEITHECEFVTHLPLSGRSVSDVNAMRTLRNEAGRQGANLVLLVMESRSTVARAEGYLCAD